MLAPKAEDPEEPADQSADGGPEQRGTRCGLQVPPPTGDLLHEPEVRADDRDTIDREPVVGEEVDGALGFGVIRVGTDDLPWHRFGLHAGLQ